MKNKTNKEKHKNYKCLASYAFGMCIDLFKFDNEPMNRLGFTFDKKKIFDQIFWNKNSAKTTKNYLGQEEEIKAVYIVY
mgnify:CR=1 FL=1